MADEGIYYLGDNNEVPSPAPSHSHPPSRGVSNPEDSKEILDIFQAAVAQRASDIHLQVGSHPVFRTDGILFTRTETKPITDDFMKGCVDRFLNEREKRSLYENLQLDFSLSIPGISHRFRVNLFFQRGHLSGVFRLVSLTPPTLEQLSLPPIMKNLAELPNGLVLVTGPTGSGKSSTLAAVVNQINLTRKAHIITISDPIECLHKNRQSLISQREIGSDATSFASALRVALREDPDVIMVEEMRDLESIAIALTAAETGHLVLATLHTNDVVQAVDRIIDVFPPNQQSQIRLQLALSLQAVISQVLIKKKNGAGRVPACEIMVVTSAIRNLIRDNQIVQIYSAIGTGRSQGMILRNDAIEELVRKDVISQQEAEAYFV